MSYVLSIRDMGGLQYKNALPGIAVPCELEGCGEGGPGFKAILSHTAGSNPAFLISSLR